jgi:hypothetical protein
LENQYRSVGPQAKFSVGTTDYFFRCECVCGYLAGNNPKRGVAEERSSPRASEINSRSRYAKKPDHYGEGGIRSVQLPTRALLFANLTATGLYGSRLRAGGS